MTPECEFADLPLGEDRVLRLAGCPGETVRFRWGSPWAWGSAAYWVYQCRLRGDRSPPISAGGSTLTEEVVWCLLGGYGVTAEMARGAYGLVVKTGLFEGCVPTRRELERALSQPYLIDDRLVRYRFPKQRSERILSSLERLNHVDWDGLDDLTLRACLQQLPGVGPKTASWIVRNLRSSDKVAIIDVHIRRAGLLSGFFGAGWRLPRDYYLFEGAFLGVAEVGSVRASTLDTVMWEQMRQHQAVRRGRWLQTGNAELPSDDDLLRLFPPQVWASHEELRGCSD